MILTPVAVTKDNVNDTVIKDGFWTAAQICTAAVRSRLQGGGYPVSQARRGRRREAPPGRPPGEAKGHPDELADGHFSPSRG